MFFNSFKYFLFFLIILFYPISYLKSDIINNIQITGNERIPDETILMFSKFSVGDSLTEDSLNKILVDLYESNFFENVSILFKDNKLIIDVKENPLIQNINFKGIKAKKILEAIKDGLKLKERTSYNENFNKDDVSQIISNLKDLGYYFASVNSYVESFNGNIVDLTYDIDLGNKAKIKKISFIGDKVFKDSKLKSIIVSEEYKFWKFISGKKFLNENIIEFDKRLLKNFYLNKGFYNVKINSSFAKITGDDEFELVYNIDANKKIYFGQIDLSLPIDFDKNNFKKLDKLFLELKDEAYSLNSVSKILDTIDLIVLSEQFESVNAKVEEQIIDDKINLTFKILENEKFIVERINIYGNNITRENVIRNNLDIDEGDFYNEILTKKSENNIKSLNLFKSVSTRVIDGDNDQSKIIEIDVEEKATGEIMAGAGFGTDGGSLSFGVKENNYLGKGIRFSTDLTLNAESIKGQIGVSNPNYNNSDKLVYANVQVLEIDRLKDFGYKTNKTGFDVGTKFEYLEDFNLGVGTSTFYERIETDSLASARQKSQAGNYWDTFLKMNLDYDKRNQKFKTTNGFRSFYNIDLPIVSDTNTLTNSYDYKYYTELYENNITSASIFFKTANSLSGNDIKLSERLFIPSRRLRGFEAGKIGPKDGEDFVGGNYITSLNFNTTIPQLFPNAQSFDFVFFLDAANIWGVDYDSSINGGSDIRSSLGFGIDWLTVVGPLNFSLAQPITKSNGDITETFRFNLGTTF